MQIQGPHSARSKPKKAQILNSQLVREILEREDWSGWKGCTILDMNPGEWEFFRKKGVELANRRDWVCRLRDIFKSAQRNRQAVETYTARTNCGIQRYSPGEDD